MAGEIFMRVDEVAEELGVSVPYAYKLIREMNEELRKTGCITIILRYALCGRFAAMRSFYAKSILQKTSSDRRAAEDKIFNQRGLGKAPQQAKWEVPPLGGISHFRAILYRIALLAQVIPNQELRRDVWKSTELMPNTVTLRYSIRNRLLQDGGMPITKQGGERNVHSLYMTME